VTDIHTLKFHLAYPNCHYLITKRQWHILLLNYKRRALLNGKGGEPGVWPCEKKHPLCLDLFTVNCFQWCSWDRYAKFFGCFLYQDHKCSEDVKRSRPCAIPSPGKGRKGFTNVLIIAHRPLPATAHPAAPLPWEEIKIIFRTPMVLIQKETKKSRQRGCLHAPGHTPGSPPLSFGPALVLM